MQFDKRYFGVITDLTEHYENVGCMVSHSIVNIQSEFGLGLQKNGTYKLFSNGVTLTLDHEAMERLGRELIILSRKMKRKAGGNSDPH